MSQSEEPEAHPGQDQSGRFLADAYLRRHGFRIHSRPRTGDALWERGGRLYSEQEALDEADRD